MSYRERLLNSLGDLLSTTLNRRVFLVSEPHNGLSKIMFHDGKRVLFYGTFHESEFLSPRFKEKVMMEAEMSVMSNFPSLRNPSTQHRIFPRRQPNR